MRRIKSFSEYLFNESNVNTLVIIFKIPVILLLLVKINETASLFHLFFKKIILGYLKMISLMIIIYLNKHDFIVGSSFKLLIIINRRLL